MGMRALLTSNVIARPPVYAVARSQAKTQNRHRSYRLCSRTTSQKPPELIPALVAAAADMLAFIVAAADAAMLACIAEFMLDP